MESREVELGDCVACTRLDNPPCLLHVVIEEIVCGEVDDFEFCCSWWPVEYPSARSAPDCWKEECVVLMGCCAGTESANRDLRPPRALAPKIWSPVVSAVSIISRSTDCSWFEYTCDCLTPFHAASFPLESHKLPNPDHVFTISGEKSQGSSWSSPRLTSWSWIVLCPLQKQLFLEFQSPEFNVAKSGYTQHPPPICQLQKLM
jgi:hypothetical protein